MIEHWGGGGGEFQHCSWSFSQVSWFLSKWIASKVELSSTSKDLKRFNGLSVRLEHLWWIVRPYGGRLSRRHRANQHLCWLIIKGQGSQGVWAVIFHTGSQLFGFAFFSVHYSACRARLHKQQFSSGITGNWFHKLNVWKTFEATVFLPFSNFFILYYWC